MPRRKKDGEGGGDGSGPRRRGRPIPTDYLEMMEYAMGVPGEEVVVWEGTTRTRGYAIAKNINEGRWPVPEGTRLKDWTVTAGSGVRDGKSGPWSQVYATWGKG